MSFEIGLQVFQVKEGTMTTIYPTKGGLKNVILRLNDEQLVSLMASSMSEDVQVRAVVKSNQIIGLKVVRRGKNEVVKCSWMNESGGKVYLRDKAGDACAEIGDVNGKISLINFKPVVNGEMSEVIENRRKIRDLVLYIVGTGKLRDEGIEFNEKEVNEKFGGEKGILQSVCTKGNFMDYKWVKLVKCDSKIWKDFLVREGYNDEIPEGRILRMLYSGKVEKETKEEECEGESEDDRVKSLILEYQKIYVEYYQLYHNIESNYGIKKLIGMHNRLEELRCQIGSK